MEKLARYNPAFVIDALSGRLAFERTGVKLYDTVIAKLERNPQPQYSKILRQLRHIREEEKEHEEWLEQQIRSLGANPADRSDLAQLELREGAGIVGIIEKEDKVIHLLHALLAAELADNAGWDVLRKLAGDAGDADAERAFARREAEEAKHLLFMREVVLRAAEIELLGREKELPRSFAGVMLKKVAALGATLIGLAAVVTSAVLLARSRHRLLHA
jgi:bacterioferritin (cytochrome b1)